MLRSLRNIRTRLTLWNIAVFGGILLVYAVGTGWFFLGMLDRHLDDNLKEDLELIDQMLVHAPAETPGVDIHQGEVHRLERFVEIWSLEGALLYRSAALGRRSIGGPPGPGEGTGPFASSPVLLEDGTSLRVGVRLHSAGGSPRVIRLAISEEAYFSETREYITFVFVGIPVALLVVAAGGYLLARRALYPVDKLVATVQQIGGRDLKERLPVQNAGDELGRLALSFNDLLARIEEAFDQLRRFTADASHELRTPLTALRSVGEVGAQGERTPEEYREVIGSMLEEVDRLTRLVDSLLLLSRADSATLPLRVELLDISLLGREAAELTGVLADQKNQRVVFCSDGAVFARCERALLSQALLNLLDNAIKFSPPASTVIVEAGSAGGRAFLRVSDQGPGIGEEEQELVFRRFYRSASVRGVHTGSGLGLAISKWAVDAQGGTLTLRSERGAGSAFTIELPEGGAPLKAS